MKRILLVFTVGLPIWCYAGPGPVELVWEIGTHRLQGRCLSMTSHGRDELSLCKEYITIMVDDAELPSFLFSRADGSWMFQTNSPAVYSDDRMITYPEVSLLDAVENKAYDFSGECVLDPSSPPYLTLECAVWFQPGKNIKEASFVGSGRGVFSTR